MIWAASRHLDSSAWLSWSAAVQGKGMSLGAYIRNHRLARSYDDPLLGDDPIRAIAARRESAGSAHFSRVFQDRYGPPPSRLRRTPR
jgi:AraC-like DNA-binding protein